MASKDRLVASSIQTKFTTQADAFAKRSENIVGDFMWPILFFLKLSGHAPLSYERTNLSGRKANSNSIVQDLREARAIVRHSPRKYKLNWRSVSVLWSVGCALWILYGWSHFAQRVLVTLHSSKDIFGLPNSLNVTTRSESMLQADVYRILIGIEMIFALIHVTELLLAWTEADSQAEFLNDWADIQKLFETTFSSHFLWNQRYMNLRRCRNMLFFAYLAGPMVLFFLLFFISQLQSDFASLLTTLIAAFPHSFHVSAVALMEDIKAIMTYRVLAEAFGQIRDNMQYSLSVEKLTLGKMKGWKKLVQSLRLQVEHAGHSQKNHQLLLIIGSIVLATSAIFILFKLSWRNSDCYLIALSCAAFSVVQLGKIYFKIIAANRIVYEEGLIARDLITIEAKDDDVSTQLEIKFVYDIIMQNPSIISFGNYAKLNEGLLLGIGSQIVTYLIVLMQVT